MSRSLLLKIALGVATWVACACKALPTDSSEQVGNPSFARPGPTPPSLRAFVPITLTGGMANALLSDGRASVPDAPTGSYDDGVCGVIVQRDSDTTNALYFRPAGFVAPKGKSTCPPPRAAYVELSPSTPVHLSDDPHQDTSLGTLGLLTADELFALGSMKVRGMTHTTEVTQRPATVNIPFCLDDGVGRGMRYNPVDYLGSDNLVVTPISAGRWHAQSQPWPNNKAWCLHTNADGSSATLIMHLDVAADVQEIP